MEYLKKLFRITLSTFIPFVLLAKIENTYIPYQDHPIVHLHEFALYDLKVLFATTMPLFYLVAVIIQGLIVIPVWDALKKSQHMALFFFGIFFIVIISSLGLNYILWERSTGVVNLLRSSLTLIIIQSIYWIFNFFTLYVTGKFNYRKISPVTPVTKF
jgi:hypothetical protein